MISKFEFLYWHNCEEVQLRSIDDEDEEKEIQNEGVYGYMNGLVTLMFL